MSDPEWWEKTYTEKDWKDFVKSQASFESKTMNMVKSAKKHEKRWVQNQAALILSLHNKRLIYLDRNREIMHPAHIKEMEYSTQVTRRLLRKIIEKAKRIGIKGPFIPVIVAEDLEKYR